LFLISVVDNHNHGNPVATMVMQREDGNSIAHALRILREWNPEWAPKVSAALQSAALNTLHHISSSLLKSCPLILLSFLILLSL